MIADFATAKQLGKGQEVVKAGIIADFSEVEKPELLRTFQNKKVSKKLLKPELLRINFVIF